MNFVLVKIGYAFFSVQDPLSIVFSLICTWLISAATDLPYFFEDINLCSLITLLLRTESSFLRTDIRILLFFFAQCASKKI